MTEGYIERLAREALEEAVDAYEAAASQCERERYAVADTRRRAHEARERLVAMACVWTRTRSGRPALERAS